MAHRREPPASYNVYRSSSPSGPWTKLNSSAITATTFTDTSPPTGVISYYEVTSVDASGTESIAVTGQTPSRVGVYQAGTWYLDKNGDQQWDPANGDISYTSFNPPAGTVPVSGAWSTSINGKSIGLFDPNTGTFYLDANGNGHWDSGTDGVYAFGQPGDQPVIGNWNGGHTSQVGVFRPSNNTFYLDSNGNGTFDAGTDISFTVAPPSGGNYIAVAGDWTKSGTTQVGLYDQNSGTFYLYDLSGNLTNTVQFIYVPGALPVIGDWDGDGADDVGVWNATSSTFYLDSNGDYQWDAGDAQFTFTGSGGQPFAF